MKDSRTPKIVIAVGLAAVYATGLAMVTLRDAPDSNYAQEAAVAPAAQLATAPVDPAAMASESPSASTSVTEQPAAVTEAPAPVASTTTSKLAAATRAVEADARSTESTTPKEEGSESVAVATASRAERRDIATPDPTGEVANVDNESATSEEASSSEEDESASTGSVDVLTEDGVVN